jgi:hypothetical protein
MWLDCGLFNEADQLKLLFSAKLYVRIMFDMLEMIWEVAMAYSQQYPVIHLERLRKTTVHLSPRRYVSQPRCKPGNSQI